MGTATQAKILHGLGTALILLFALQLGLAVASEFAPRHLGRALYPIFLGRDPIALPNVLINCGLLVLALVAFFYADVIERKALLKERLGRKRSTREGSVHFSQ